MSLLVIILVLVAVGILVMLVNRYGPGFIDPQVHSIY
jgi:hypothetical protein